MDYIIFGIGSGASLVLFGWMIREWGPALRDRAPEDEDVLSASDMVLRMAWARFCATSGMALVLCGCLILIATAIAAALAVSDDRGGMTVLVVFALALPLMLLWLGLYLRQFGSYGVIRRKPTLDTTTQATPAVAADSATATAGEARTGESAAGEPSFTEAVTAPGGLGRFSAFFRKDDVQPAADDAATYAEAAADSREDDLEERATTDVIAAIGGDRGTDDKRLDPRDPLVTAVYGERADSLVPVVPSPPASSPADDAPSSEETALDTLRKQRIARLAQSAPRDENR